MAVSSAKGFPPALGLRWGVSAFAATGVYRERGASPFFLRIQLKKTKILLKLVINYLMRQVLSVQRMKILLLHPQLAAVPVTRPSSYLSGTRRSLLELRP